MKQINIEKICECPQYCEMAAQWFSQKWSIPFEAYQESIHKCIEQKTKIPQWYIVINSIGNIIAGAGIIENDFHNRTDLSPNLCALFVEEKYRKLGLATYILNFARKDLGAMGFKKIYLVTDITGFYEKCGWDFLTMVKDDNGNFERMYTACTLR